MSLKFPVRQFFLACRRQSRRRPGDLSDPVSKDPTPPHSSPSGQPLYPSLPPLRPFRSSPPIPTLPAPFLPLSPRPRPFPIPSSFRHHSSYTPPPTRLPPISPSPPPLYSLSSPPPSPSPPSPTPLPPLHVLLPTLPPFLTLPLPPYLHLSPPLLNLSTFSTYSILSSPPPLPLPTSPFSLPFPLPPHLLATSYPPLSQHPIPVSLLLSPPLLFSSPLPTASCTPHSSFISSLSPPPAPYPLLYPGPHPLPPLHPPYFIPSPTPPISLFLFPSLLFSLHISPFYHSLLTCAPRPLLLPLSCPLPPPYPPTPSSFPSSHPFPSSLTLFIGSGGLPLVLSHLSVIVKAFAPASRFRPSEARDLLLLKGQDRSSQLVAERSHSAFCFRDFRTEARVGFLKV